MEARLTTIITHVRARPLDYLPGMVLGVFLARVVGELVGLPGLWAAVALSVALGAFGAWLLTRWPVGATWPALILSAYVFYPEPSIAIALRVAAVAFFAYGFNNLKTDSSLSPLGRLSSATVAVALAVAAFLLYWSTLAPDVLAADSGELQVVAAQLGVAHPPGFPLYVMIAHLFTRLPFTTPAYAVNLFSAVTSALTVAAVYLGGLALTRRQLPGLIAAVSLASATTFWSQATTANVRSLTGLFAALILLALLGFRSAVARGERGTADRRLTLAALFMGFGLTHHVSLLFLVAVGLLFVAVVDPSLLRTPRRWLWPAVAGLLGLLPLLYLPARAMADVRGASPALATWPGFLEHVLATGFRGDLFYFLTPADLFQRLRVMGNVMGFQFDLWLLVGMAVGLVLLIYRDRPAALLLGGVFGVYTLVAATYRAPQTVEYMMPAYVAAVLLLAAAVAGLPEAMNRFGRAGTVVGALLAAVITVGAIGQFGGHLSASGAKHEGADARAYAEPLLAGAPPDSVILAHWHWATPLWYLQEVEVLRPDVDVRFVFPEGESYEATWERRTREALADGRPVVTTWVPIAPPAGLPVPEPLGEALLYPLEPRTTLPADFVPQPLSLGESVELLGYQIEHPADGAIALGDEAVITVAWRATGALADGAGLFLHLVGADGALAAQDDRPVVSSAGVNLTQFRITPRPGTSSGGATIYVGATGGATDARVALAPLTIIDSNRPTWTRSPVQRALLDGSGTRLVGYDWDRTLAEQARLYLHWQTADGSYTTQVADDVAVEDMLLPAYRGPWGVPVREWTFPRDQDGGHYVPLGEGIVWTGETLNGLSLAPGEPTVVDGEFHSSRPINRDYVVSTRLIGLEIDGVHWDWWDLEDSIPAMGAIPTLKWVDGSFVRSPHRVTVAETAAPGQELTGALTLYDAFTNRPLPILDERMTAENPWIPLCSAVVEAETQ